MADPLDAMRLQQLYEESQEAIQLINAVLQTVQAQMLELERCQAELLACRHKIANLTVPASMRHPHQPRSPL